MADKPARNAHPEFLANKIHPMTIAQIQLIFLAKLCVG
jgi:hypothetical protein